MICFSQLFICVYLQTLNPYNNEYTYVHSVYGSLVDLKETDSIKIFFITVDLFRTLRRDEEELIVRVLQPKLQEGSRDFVSVHGIKENIPFILRK